MAWNFILYFWGNSWISAPLPPSDVMVTAISNDSLSLNWTYNSNATFVESWNVTHTSLIDGTSETATILANASQYVDNYNVTGLTSGHTYSISIYSVVQNVVSEAISLNVSVSKYYCKSLVDFIIIRYLGNKTLKLSFFSNLDFNHLAENFLIHVPFRYLIFVTVL